MVNASQYDQVQTNGGRPSDNHPHPPPKDGYARSAPVSSGYDGGVSPLDEDAVPPSSQGPSTRQGTDELDEEIGDLYYAGHNAISNPSSKPSRVPQVPPKRSAASAKQASASIPLSSLQPQSLGYGGAGPQIVDSGTVTLHHFSRRRQRLRLFWHAFLRALFTLALIAAFVALLLSYENQVIFLSGKRNIFSAVTTGLSIALGLHLFSSLKWLTECLRWFILANRDYHVEEANLILQSSSQIKVLKLFFKTAILGFPRGLFKNKLPLLCILWVLINLGFQVAIASLGLTYEITDSPHLFLVQDTVGVPNIGAFEWRNKTEVNQDQQLYAAHSLGLIGSSMYFGSNQDDNYLGAVQDLNTTAARTIFQNPDGWTYRFVDSSKDGKITFATNRTINSTFSCKFYDVQHGEDGENVLNTISVDGFDRSLYVGDLEQGASTYLTRDQNQCDNARCTRVLVFQATDKAHNITAAGFYDCNITISNVMGAYHPAHELADSQARIAAGAITFGGAKNTSFGFGGTTYQLYPNNAYGANSTQGSASDMGAFVSSFAIQSIASVAAFIPRTNITTGRNDSPATGYSLNVDWAVAGAIFGIVGGGHILLSLLMILPVSMVLVIHGEGLVGIEGGAGTKKDLVRYGYVERGSGGEKWWHAAVSREMVKGNGKGKGKGIGKWPDGTYDVR